MGTVITVLGYVFLAVLLGIGAIIWKIRYGKYKQY